ncbi:UNVERIFIED_CONTAM: hypothetical protein HDU68_008339 [Siphonaria sp. JEL0065]|nr:hypothetical protein HDU68_008339 [Siphonaria sp. JEL0065]
MYPPTKPTNRPPATFHGHIKEEIDAKVLIEACVHGEMEVLNTSKIPPRVTIISGTCAVFQEGVSNGMLQRWRDGLSWSSSRIQGQFLLYREVTPGKEPSLVPNLEPASSPFANTVVRGNYTHVPNGLAKRTITAQGSNNVKYRVICYFFPKDVSHLYDGLEGMLGGQGLRVPSEDRRFAKYLSKGEEKRRRSCSVRCLSIHAFEDPLQPPVATNDFPQEPHHNQAARYQYGYWHRYSGYLPYQPHLYYNAGFSQYNQPSDMYHNTLHNSTPQMYYNLLITKPCNCGGLESRKHSDTQQWEVGWEHKPVQLAPLRNHVE